MSAAGAHGLVLVLILVLGGRHAAAQFSSTVTTAAPVQSCSGCAVTTTEARCAGLSLTAVPGCIPTDIPAVILSNNSVTSIELNTFARFTLLTRLMLDSNALTSIHRYAFNDLKKLETLSLSNNPLSWLPSDVFNPLMSIGSLDLSDCAMSTLNATLFIKLSTLTTLSAYCSFFWLEFSFV
eukprot:m.36175 g.36175  ORF g.36175 m.36175 type:complete len:181 (-) comp44530_c0_seq1:68-610(-)